MRSSKRVLGLAVAVAAVAGSMVLPSTAQAQSCVPVPFSSTGITIEGAGHEVRVPAVSGLAVCYATPGTTGIPWVRTEPGGGFSVIVTGSSGGDGYVSLRYTADGVPSDLTVPLPGGGGSGETCLLGFGYPARPDCAFKISPDNDPIPTVPPVTPEPLPTVPPVETPPPDPFCPTGRQCIPYGGSILQEPYYLVQEVVAAVRDEVARFLADPCNYVLPHATCN